MQKDTLLTVIITIFNVESYLIKCIESVRKQSYKYIEILLIDDGSTDKSGSICDEYAQKDKRIKAYHKENGGLVSARKAGVELAKGEVITFVDADDWIEPDMYQCMMEKYENNKPDLVTSGIVFQWEDRTKIELDSVGDGIYEKEEILSEILPRIANDVKTGKPGITASVWNKLFQSSLLRKVLKNTDTELTLGEDAAVTYLFIAQANRIVVMGCSWYHYVQREGSLIRQNGLDSFEKIYRLERNLMDGFEELGLASKMKQQIMYYVKTFLHRSIQRVYDLDLRDITFMFPYECIPKDSRIIVYGAGKVGRSYCKCIQHGEYAVLSAWVDTDYINLQREGLQVGPPEIVRNIAYDYIVIGVNSRSMADEIRCELWKLGVKEEQIIWKVPRIIC